ncbi:MAG TPA: ABC transporter permease [Thermoleophilaceae bacterium]|nr:ABC transporter permease [Thermoleophilaceae bacterium]
MSAHSVAEVVPGASAADRAVTVIQPTKGWIGLQLRELWSFRELWYFLIWRDVKVRYKQTLLGGAWAVIPPVLMMIVFTVVLRRVGHFSSDGKPYALFSYAALVPWTLFTAALTGVSDSMVANSQLVSKIYFPRLLLPLAAATAPLVDFGIALGLLAILMAVFSTAPTLAALLIPLLVLLTLVSALAFGLWFSALNVRYRDFRYTVPFMIQLGLFITPVAYATSSLPNAAQKILALNPMTGVIEGFRWALLDTAAPSVSTLAISVTATIVLLVSGLAHFRRAERTFADII